MATFLGTPNMLVRLHTPIGRIKGFRFDAEGRYTTEHPRLIKRIADKFQVEPIQQFKCKKCDFQTENKGQLMSHYKKHKEEVTT